LACQLKIRASFCKTDDAGELAARGDDLEARGGKAEVEKFIAGKTPKILRPGCRPAKLAMKFKSQRPLVG
jgi:hypothetical protein